MECPTLSSASWLDVPLRLYRWKNWTLSSLTLNINYPKEKMEQSANGWQNQGIMRQYANENIEYQYKEVFLSLVDKSFAYGKKITPNMSMDQWARHIGCSKGKFMRHINWLIDNKFVKVLEKKGFKHDGGKFSPAYMPNFPEKATLKWIDANKKDKIKYEETTWRETK